MKITGRRTDARDLNSGDTLRAPDGTGLRIDKVTHWKASQESSDRVSPVGRRGAGGAGRPLVHGLM